MVGRGTVGRPPDEVFAFVADAENNPRWHAHVHETHWLDAGPTRPGRRGRQVGRLFGRDWSFVAEVADWDPPNVVSFQVVQGQPVRTTIRVEPAAAGSLVTVTVELPPILSARLDPLFSWLLERATGRRGRSDIARLEAALGEDAPRS
jgi:uncharacterized protein YndB with AHSA1/START domain